MAGAKEPTKKARRAQAIFDHFLRAVEQAGRTTNSTKLAQYEVPMVDQMIRDLGECRAQEVVEFAVRNWDRLARNDDQMDYEINFYRITAPWRYRAWSDMIDKGTEKTFSQEEAVDRFDEHERRRAKKYAESIDRWMAHD